MKQMKALLTDLDGTLIHSQDCICKALAESFRHVEVRVPEKSEIMAIFGVPVEEMLIMLTSISKDDMHIIDEFIAEYKRQYPVFMADAALIPNSLSTVEGIAKAGYPICLITSERRKNAEFILHRLGFAPYITYLVTRDDVIHFKPHPEPILKGIQCCNVVPRECVYIGEAPYDIQAGVAAGVYTVAVPSGSWSKESLIECRPDLVIEDIKDLSKLFHRKDEGILKGGYKHEEDIFIIVGGSGFIWMQCPC